MEISQRHKNLSQDFHPSAVNTEKRNTRSSSSNKTLILDHSYGSDVMTFSHLTSALSKGQRGGQWGSEECMFRFKGKEKVLPDHRGYRTSLENAHNS